MEQREEIKFLIGLISPIKIITQAILCLLIFLQKSI
jgi:hypothetical protein